jgi:hypothetical protein
VESFSQIDLVVRTHLLRGDATPTSSIRYRRNARIATTGALVDRLSYRTTVVLGCEDVVALSNRKSSYQHSPQ